MSVSASLPNDAAALAQPAGPCLIILFGASGDLSKRLLLPAIYNLACDGLLPERFAILGCAMDGLTTEQFRDRLSNDIKKYHTRHEFAPDCWDDLCQRLHYLPVQLDDAATIRQLVTAARQLAAQYKTEGNQLVYCAVPPWAFGRISASLNEAGFHDGPGWRRIIVEKPFGTNLDSARQLNAEILQYWREDQVYRIDHYLGKETVQNLLAFRFSNGIYEPLWNRHYIDHVQLNVSEVVDVENRGGYYDGAGVVRDMMQNHMFQMLAYLGMEPPATFAAEDVRNEKAKLLQAVRRLTPPDVPRCTVRGQYGALLDASGAVAKPGYRHESGVKPDSNTETYAAYKLLIDNDRWNGVPFYLRSGKALSKRGTEIVIRFKKSPMDIFRGTPVQSVSANRLIFHIQPRQAIETSFNTKVPGPVLQLQAVHQRFDYAESFRAARATGYEVMIYNCIQGDATLFSRTDFVEAAWEVAQPILDYWAATPADGFPNYPRGSWGPREANDLIERDGRRWLEVVTPEVLEQCELFRAADHMFLRAIIMELQPRVARSGELIIRQGDLADEMYLINHGEVEVIDAAGRVLSCLTDGGFFGEIGLLRAEPRTATVRAKTQCDLFVLRQSSFRRLLQEQPHVADRIRQVAKERYHVSVADPASKRPAE